MDSASKIKEQTVQSLLELLVFAKDYPSITADACYSYFCNITPSKLQVTKIYAEDTSYKQKSVWSYAFSGDLQFVLTECISKSDSSSGTNVVSARVQKSLKHSFS